MSFRQHTQRMPRTRSSTPDKSPSHFRARRPLKPKVLVGLDFGTTNTSIAFKLSTWPQDTKPEILSSFPGDPQADQSGRQLPSVIAYSSNSSKEALIGFEAQELFAKPSGHAARAAYPDELYVERAKLLLYQSRHTEEVRVDLVGKIKHLQRLGLIREYHDVISHFLTACLKHVKLVLYRDHNIDETCDVEIAFCVPVIGTPTTNLLMSMCLREAMKIADFGTGGATPYNIFMVNEAEAAAMYAIESNFHHIEAREIVANIDSGGGTTEGAVHIISRGHPLRLRREVIAAQGIMWGGTDVPQEFRMKLQEDIKDRSCFGSIEPDWTVADLIEACVRKFDIFKRTFANDDNDKTHEFHMVNLLKSESNPRLVKGHYVLSSKDIGKIFGKVANKVESFMLKLLNDARTVIPEIHKIVLTGGFGDSPYLRTVLKRSILEYNQENLTDIELIFAPPHHSGTSTAIGTLLRALDKAHGPTRALRMSVGVVRDIACEVAAYRKLGIPEVMEQKRERGRDGTYYIREIIQWLLKAGTDDSQRSYKHTFKSSHLFTMDDAEWIATEELVMHPTATEDYWKKTDSRNEGFISGGDADFDVTHLKQRIMAEQEPLVSRGRKSWSVDLDVCVEMNDIDIKLIAFWQGPDDVAPVEIPGFRICHNVRGLLDPGTGE